MKAQTSLLTKGIYIILVMVTIVLVLNRISSVSLLSAEQDRSLREKSKAMSMLEILAGNSNCLAYEERGSAEGEILDLSSHKILDKVKLDGFSSSFPDIQPDCARDFVSGYRIDVETFPVDIRSVYGKNEMTVSFPKMSWTFGDQEFSEDEALQQAVSVSIPIVVFVDEKTFIPGKMTITMVDGELEKIRGFIDKSCLKEIDFQDSFSFHYPVYFEKSTNSLCLEINLKKICQKLACKKAIDFPSGLTPGYYTIYSENESDILKVAV